MGCYANQRKTLMNNFMDDLLIDVYLQIIVMVIGMNFPKHPKKYFLNFILFIRLKFLQKQ